MTRSSIKTRLTTIFLLLSVIPIILVWFRSYQVAREVLVSRVGEGIQAEAFKTANYLDKVLAERSQRLKKWAALDILSNISKPDARPMINDFLSTVQNEDQAHNEEIFCTDSSGKIIAASKAQLIGIDIGNESWFQESVQKGQITISDMTAVSPFYKYGVTIVAPINSKANQEKVAGTIGLAINGFEIHRQINAINILGAKKQSLSSYAILIDHQGVALTQPNFDTNTTMFRRNLKQMGIQAASLAAERRNGYLAEKGLYGNDVIIGYAPSLGNENFKGMNWSVLIFQQTAEAFRPILAFQLQILGIGIVVILLVFLISLNLARDITNPIEKLVSAARAIATGDLSQRVHVRSPAEMKTLADSFNQMAEGLGKMRGELIVAKEYADNIIKSTLDSLIVIDCSGKIKTCNPAILKLLDYAESELLDQPIEFILASSSLEKKALVDQLKKGKVADAEIDYRSKDGRTISMLLSAATIEGEQKAAQGVVVLAKDITERRQTQESLEKLAAELSRSNKDLEAFAFVASHDVREPLRKIMAFGDLLNREFSDQLGETGQDYIRRMQNASSRMEKLIEDLLHYSRINTLAQPFERIALDGMIREVVTDLEVSINNAGAKVEVEKLPEIVADKSQMRQLFQNLISNAIKFHSKERAPRVVIKSGESHNGEEQILVSDNGVGFEEQYVDRIFKPFIRLHGRGEFEGTGIGLAVSQKIAARHQGSITAKSTVGKGSTFIVSLPKSPQT